MSDEVPFFAPGHHETLASHQPQPGELLFEFHVAATHTFGRVELRDHGPAYASRSNSVLKALGGDVLRPPVVRAIVDDVLEAMGAWPGGTELQDITRELERLTEAIAAGERLTPLLEALKARQARRDELVGALAAREGLTIHRFDGRSTPVCANTSPARGRSSRSTRRTVVSCCEKCSWDRSGLPLRAKRIGLKEKPASAVCWLESPAYQLTW